MDSPLSLDSHFSFFEEAEKEVFDIDSFLSPSYDIIPPLEAVLGTPFASPNKQNLNESHSVQNEASLFHNDRNVSKLRKNQKKSDISKRQKKSEMDTYIKDLERRMAELLHENSKLKESVSSLTSVKEHLETLLMQQMMKGTISQDSFESKGELELKSLSNANHYLDEVKSNPLSTTNVLLLVLLLSFSLLLHNTATSEPFDVRSANRSISDPQNPLKVQIEKNLSPNITFKIEKNDGTPQKTTKRVLRHEKTSSNRSSKRRKDEQHPPKPSPTISIVPPLFDSQSVIPHITHWKPNTTYLLCTNVSQIFPTPERKPQQTHQSSPSSISLLIPPDVLGTSRYNSLLEVNCQVMDVTYVPIRS